MSPSRKYKKTANNDNLGTYFLLAVILSLLLFLISIFQDLKLLSNKNLSIKKIASPLAKKQGWNGDWDKKIEELKKLETRHSKI